MSTLTNIQQLARAFSEVCIFDIIHFVVEKLYQTFKHFISSKYQRTMHLESNADTNPGAAPSVVFLQRYVGNVLSPMHLWYIIELSRLIPLQLSEICLKC